MFYIAHSIPKILFDFNSLLVPLFDFNSLLISDPCLSTGLPFDLFFVLILSFIFLEEEINLGVSEFSRVSSLNTNG